MPKCGSQVVLCDLPIRMDTYSGCSHNCTYCFTNFKLGEAAVKPYESVQALKNFIDGKRNIETKWCDFKIPLHIGGMSDPLQPVEEKYGITYQCLCLLAETKYPFVMSTKGKLLWSDKYLNVLKNCNCVIQVSLCSPQYDKIETGAPTFAERLEGIRKVSKIGKRLIIRTQPYMPSIKKDIIKYLPDYSSAGVYGMTIEGIKLKNKKPGMVKKGGDFVIPYEILKRDYLQIKEAAHNVGLKFYCAENRLRELSDNLCCCGVEGLGFETNKANLNHYLYDKDNFKYTEKMKEKGNSICFKSIGQDTNLGISLKGMSFADAMEKATQSNMINIFRK